MRNLWVQQGAPGTSEKVHICVPKLYGYGALHMRAVIFRGVEDGPRLLVTAGIHGDEINGAEIARQLMLALDPAELWGGVVVMPMVNVYGLVSCSRYLPDRKDLNRAFPGAAAGSLAARLAHKVMRSAVEGATHLVDLHSASLNRANLPQIRAHLEDAATADCARGFGAPALIHGSEVNGSLREAAREAGVTALLYEAGASARFNGEAITTGVQGILRLMRHLGMREDVSLPAAPEPAVLTRTTWERAPEGGFFHTQVHAGDRVREGQELGFVCDCAGDNLQYLHASIGGIVLGATVDPRVNRGDAVVHIGELKH